MNIPGLITVQPPCTALLDELAHLMGTCFLEERWYAAWLEALDALGASRERKQAITRAAIRADYEVTAPFGCVFTLPDHAGALNAYRLSELSTTSWPALQRQAELLIKSALSEQELRVLFERWKAMGPVSGSDWPSRMTAPGDDFIYVISVGVDPALRNTGVFGRLFRQLLTYADSQGTTCYLDCYSDRLEQIYGHFGFEVIERKSDPAFTIQERCMMRRPQGANA